ncbi:predicted protein [Thalassiosira pseudonana CCMP1335]|jgi:hypothetical protein|uniref:Uncharacterized protein n=1 Tax=Thalassiosira pseudonana TaxID=35128 RepID=B8C2X0_THAPS|nr:predicted protein [Thalassiosira pseudonana CCMP1335]EED92023.1 predicted protein [Thalassiosira pseudonana CCMP1335]|eukprot:scaffold3776_cov192-Alexandrium_tamarense.AAC.14
MKVVSLFCIVASASAFAPSLNTPRRSATSLSAAKSAAEDLELTLKVIMDNMTDDNQGIDDSDDDTPYEPPTPPAAAPVAAAPAAAASSTGIELWSVDYDAAAKLAYAAAGSQGDFGAFREKYLADTSAMCGKKNPFV